MSTHGDANPYQNITEADQPRELGCMLMGAVMLLACGVAAMLMFASYMIPFVLLVAEVISFEVAFALFLVLGVMSVVIPFLGAGSLFKWLSHRPLPVTRAPRDPGGVGRDGPELSADLTGGM